MDKVTKDTILKNNPRADRKVIQDFEKLKGKLNRLGVKTDTGYSLEPPLGNIRASSLIKPSVRKPE
jgi:hypothetical protein